MTFRFGERSEARLKTCHLDLQRVARRTIHHVDFSVLWGHRKKDQQNEEHRQGRSRLRYPHSRHNTEPSFALDICPFPMDFANRETARQCQLARRRYVLLAGMFLSTAHVLGVRLRWGGDWAGGLMSPPGSDLLTAYSNQNFDDLGHFELVEPD